jgi:antitoxin component of MazEF toxin-antitoxin module
MEDGLMEKYVKARKQGNSIVVTIPSNLAVAPGTQYKIEKKDNGELILKPSKKMATSLDDLFEDWHGSYQRANDLNDWENTKPVGEELW